MGKNRTMESKRVKRIKQIRARPRYLKMNSGYMSCHPYIDRERIPDEARALFEYRKRAVIDGRHDNEAFVNAILLALFPNNNPPMVDPPKEQHLRLRINQPVNRHLMLVNGKYRKLAMVSDGNMTCFQFFEYLTVPALIKRSCTYGSYDRAMKVFQLETIHWIENLSIPNVENSPLG